MNFKKKIKLAKLKKMMNADINIFGGSIGILRYDYGGKAMKFTVGKKEYDDGYFPFHRLDDVYNKFHTGFSFRDLIPDIEFEFKFMVEAYLANIVHMLNHDLPMVSKLLPTEYGRNQERKPKEHSYLEVRNIKDQKFTWCVSWKLEKMLTETISQKSMIWESFQILHEQSPQFTLFESYKPIGNTGSRIFVTPDQEKSRQELHKMIVSHPHFKNINESWIKKTGHKLNWFKHPLSAISGQIIWDGKKYVHQDSSKNTGWHLSFTDDIDGKLVIPRKFAS
jgi:hypothetical protein